MAEISCDKIWYSIIVDGKKVCTLEDSPKVRKEIQRVRTLAGVEIVPTSRPKADGD